MVIKGIRKIFIFATYSGGHTQRNSTFYKHDIHDKKILENYIMMFV
jgi:hypothetical protein